MKKMIKLSLVAAVAVAGLTTTASAANLEEAIKGVDVSGMVQYRYEDTNVKNGASTQLNDYDAEMNIKVPVNDSVTANLKIDVAGDLKDTDGATVGDAKPSVNLEDVYFTYNAGVATVMAGKQNIPGPFSDGAQGTGIVALVPAGPVTLAAAYFNMHSVNGDAAEYTVGQTNVTALAAIAKAGPVDLDVYYADVDSTLDLTSVHAAGTFGPVSVDARYSTKDFDAETAANNDVNLLKITASMKAGPATVTAGYAASGEDNAVGQTTAVDNDNDAAVDFKVWQASIGALTDAKAFLISAGMPLGPVNASLTYVDAEHNGDTGASANDDASEILAKVVYPMSKNFSATVMYSELETQNTGAAAVETQKGRLELKYTF